MKDIIIIAVIATILLSALWYILRTKKKGRKCIGCPDCSGNCSGCHCK